MSTMERVTRFLVHSLTCPKLNVNHRAKPVIYRGVEHHLKVPVRYCLQWRKTTVGWFQRATSRNRRVQLESIALLQNCKMKQKNVVLKCKKSLFLRKFSACRKFQKFSYVGFFIRGLNKSCPSEEVSSLRFLI